MRPLKVGFYVAFPRGGIGRYTRELMRALGGTPDVRVSLLCLPEYEWRNAPEYDVWPGLRTISHPRPIVRRFQFLRSQFVNPVRGIQYARRTNLDVLHFANVHHLTFPLWRPLLRAKRPFLAISAHDVRRQKAILSRSWEDAQLRRVYQFADALFVHSESQVRELVDFASIVPDKIHIVPHGPYEFPASRVSARRIRERLGLRKGDRVLLFFGQLRDEKNLEGLLEALTLCRRRTSLVVAGTPAGGRHVDGRAYRRRVTALGLDDRVRIIDRYVEEKEVGDLFGLADAVALPYDETFTSQSGVLHIAAHYRRPLLASLAPSLRETVESFDLGVVCSTGRPEGLAAGIDRLMERIERGCEFGFHRYHAAHSWEENARRTLAVYEELLGDREDGPRPASKRMSASGGDR